MCSNNVVKLNNRGATINSQDYQQNLIVWWLLSTISKKIGARRPLLSDAAHGQVVHELLQLVSRQPDRQPVQHSLGVQALAEGQI
jgi:hypothetical protein